MLQIFLAISQEGTLQFLWKISRLLGRLAIWNEVLIRFDCFGNWRTFASFVKLRFAYVLHLRKQVLYHKLLWTFRFVHNSHLFLDSNVPRFGSCALAVLQKFVYVLPHCSKNFFAWPIFQRALFFKYKSKLNARAVRTCYTCRKVHRS